MMSHMAFDERLVPVKADASTAVELLRQLLPKNSRPAMKAVKNVPLSMFLSLYRGAFTVNAGVRATEDIALEAWSKAGGHPQLRRPRGHGTSETAFFEYLGTDNLRVMLKEEHWSMYPDLYRKITNNRVSDLTYSRWDKLERLLGDLYLRVDALLLDDKDDPDNAYFTNLFYQRLQVWSNLLALAKSKPTFWADYDYWA